jgi:hypothetical protein
VAETFALAVYENQIDALNIYSANALTKKIDALRKSCTSKSSNKQFRESFSHLNTRPTLSP